MIGNADSGDQRRKGRGNTARTPRERGTWRTAALTQNALFARI